MGHSLANLPSLLIDFHQFFFVRVLFLWILFLMKSLTTFHSLWIFVLSKKERISSLEGSDRQCTSPVAFVIWLWKADRTKSASDVGHAFLSVFWKTNKTNKTQLSVKLYVCLRFRYIITWTDYLLTFYEHFVWYPDFVYFSVVWSISMKITISN